jgi:Ran GTPase-activating protein (RanGAP) involved in mRNA processing and transport
LYNIPNLQGHVLTDGALGNVGLVELVPALYNNTSIKVLDVSDNDLIDMASAEILRDVLHSNKTMTTLDLSGNEFGLTEGVGECIADGLGRNYMLIKINLSDCALGDDGVSTLAQALSSRYTTLQELTFSFNAITSMGAGVLLETMEQSSHHITDLEL